MTATCIVHWPGQSVPACDKHAAQLKNVAALMGFGVSTTPVFDLQCSNCANEAKKKASAA